MRITIYIDLDRLPVDTAEQANHLNQDLLRAVDGVLDTYQNHRSPVDREIKVEVSE